MHSLTSVRLNTGGSFLKFSEILLKGSSLPAVPPLGNFLFAQLKVSCGFCLSPLPVSQPGNSAWELKGVNRHNHGAQIIYFHRLEITILHCLMLSHWKLFYSLVFPFLCSFRMPWAEINYVFYCILIKSSIQFFLV